jgi:hypothetical protein
MLPSIDGKIYCLPCEVKIKRTRGNNEPVKSTGSNGEGALKFFSGRADGAQVNRDPAFG